MFICVLKLICRPNLSSPKPVKGEFHPTERTYPINKYHFLIDIIFSLNYPARNPG